jgi:hypothetical protein
MKTNTMKAMIGKTVLGVVVKKNIRTGGSPAMQVHLVFHDQTSVEIYSGSDFSIGGGLDTGGLEEARRYLSETMEVVYETYMGMDGKIVEKNGE